jgi:ribosomal protein S12 methylthiotransferase accessory factor
MPPGLAMLGTAPKGFHAGTHRVVSPERTLARVLPLTERMGITRVGNLTGLDVLGIPVCMACRPNSRSLAVFQGKGSTLAAAKVSAVMEAAETYHAESIDVPARFASYAEMRARFDVVDPELLPRPRACPADDDARLLWIEGRELDSGEGAWVPHELVSADYTWPQPPGSGTFLATTNGLGAGNHHLEAIAHGLYEVIERDSVTLWRMGGAGARGGRRIDPESIRAASVRELMARFEAAGIRLCLWNATSDIGIATVVCLAFDDRASEAGSDSELGCGCHPDREIATLRAITEAAQVRTTFIAGSRDDFDPSLFDEARRAERLASAREWQSGPADADWTAVPHFTSADIAADLAVVLERLRARGLDRVIWVDLTKPDLNLPVVRVIVPGLEAPHQTDAKPGHRARTLQSAALGRSEGIGRGGAR